MGRPAALRATAAAERAAGAALAACGRRVAAQYRRGVGGALKVAKAYSRRGEKGFDPNPRSVPPRAKVDPEDVAAEDFDLLDLDALASGAFADVLAGVGSDAAGAVLGQVGLTGDDAIVDRVSAAAVQAARDQAAELVSQVDESTRDMLRDVIADGLEQNLGTDGIADLIQESAAFGDDRAQLIAHTEVRNANERGALEGMRGARDAGVNIKKEVLLGPNACEVCIENADAGPIDVDESFPSGDLAPGFHVRCECAVTGVVGNDELEELARMAKYAAAPRTLYVRRDVTNAQDVIDWAKSKGFATTLPASDVHVTVAFSKEPVDWGAVPRDGRKYLVCAGGARSVEALGGADEPAYALRFDDARLSARWKQITDAGASWDWPEYKPHLTISYAAPSCDTVAIAAYDGPIVLGPEVWEEVKSGWADDVVEEVAKSPSAKVSQSAALYLDQSPYARRCETCASYRPSLVKFLGGCARVEGSISPRGWCRLWNGAQ